MEAKAEKGCGCVVKNDEGTCIAHDDDKHEQFSILTKGLKEKIWLHGCIEILKSMMRNELVETGTAWVYISLGLLLALLELVTVALAAAFVAQINRSLPGRHGVWYCLYLCQESSIVCIYARSLVLSVSLPGVWFSLGLAPRPG